MEVEIIHVPYKVHLEKKFHNQMEHYFYKKFVQS